MPVALFSIQKVSRGNGGSTYLVDASASSDAQTPSNQLLYRWNFQYDGPNDIVYSTNWSSSPLYSTYYALTGTKVIRLDVEDKDGAISSSYAQITVASSDVVAKTGY